MMRILLSHSRYIPLLWIVLIPAMVAGCAVMSDELRKEALPQLPFNELVTTASSNQGRTVILGGYVVSVENQKKETQIVAVQAPLGPGQQPKSKDLSQGRLILIYGGFIDPEVFTKDRQITVGGRLIASSTTEEHDHPFPYLRVHIGEIHLWAKPDPEPTDPFWDDDCYYHPYGFRRHGFRHPWCW